MTTTSAQRDYTAIGVLAGQLQVSVRAIERVAEQAGIAPAMRLNHVPHFDAAQVEQIIAQLSRNLSTRGA